MRQEIIEVLSVITEEEQYYRDGKHDVDKSLYTTQNTMVIDSEKLLEKGKLIQIRPHTRFIHFPRHTHNYIEMTYMIKGTTQHIINGIEVVLSEGDLIFLNQNATQEILPAGEEDIAVNFIILPEFFDKAFQMIDEEKSILRTFIVNCLRNDKSISEYMYFRSKGILPIENLLENMIWSILNKKSTNRGITQTTMGLLLLHLSLNSEHMVFGEASYDNELGIKVLRYVEENYKKAELSELANTLGYEVYWLSKKIKQITGKTFKTLLLEKRLDQAEYLLKNTSFSISEIIEKIGYTNTSYFYRIFRERYGYTPKEFRESSI